MQGEKKQEKKENCSLNKTVIYVQAELPKAVRLQCRSREIT